MRPNNSICYNNIYDKNIQLVCFSGFHNGQQLQLQHPGATANVEHRIPGPRGGWQTGGKTQQKINIISTIYIYTRRVAISRLLVLVAISRLLVVLQPTISHTQRHIRHYAREQPTQQNETLYVRTSRSIARNGHARGVGKGMHSAQRPPVACHVTHNSSTPPSAKTSSKPDSQAQGCLEKSKPI